MNQIYAKAYLEAERENIINETIFRKPDSVLEYSCFDKFVSITAIHGGPLFTETDRFTDLEIPITVSTLPLDFTAALDSFTSGLSDIASNASDELKQIIEEAIQPLTDQVSGAFDEITAKAEAQALLEKTVPFNVFMEDDILDEDLEGLVLVALKEYVDSNFAHDFLGGAAIGLNNEIEASIGSDNYDCATMDKVWFLAKCRNFALDDSFLSFDDLVSTDPRIFPEECEDHTPITYELIELSNNDEFEWVELSEYRTFLIDDLLDPSICTDPIPTGISVGRILFEADEEGNTDREIIPFDDHVCSNPGCFYNGDGACE
ncbi:MAG: hypothetical protein DHS20C02_02700 [Micavibrio sp.]|nr:MAG: hypothetical protein DHS20C02_02700 [Micavibrio sp.]